MESPTAYEEQEAARAYGEWLRVLQDYQTHRQQLQSMSLYPDSTVKLDEREHEANVSDLFRNDTHSYKYHSPSGKILPGSDCDNGDGGEGSRESELGGNLDSDNPEDSSGRGSTPQARSYIDPIQSPSDHSLSGSRSGSPGDGKDTQQSTPPPLLPRLTNLTTEQRRSLEATYFVDPAGGSYGYDTLLSSSHSEQIASELFVTSTISDDRTAEGKGEERMLIALKEAPKNKKASLRAKRPDNWIKSRPIYVRPVGKRNPLTDELSLGTNLWLATPEMSSETTMAQVTDGFEKEQTGLDLLDAIRQGDLSKVDLQKLQRYINLLQTEALQMATGPKEPVPSKYQVLYRLVTEQVVSPPYFDHPTWVEGMNTRRLQCNLPLENFQLYLERNKDVSFIVYRTFNGDPLPKRNSEPTTTELKLDNDLPRCTSETIRPTNHHLHQIIKNILETKKENVEILKDYGSSNELSAPYLFMYHSRKNLDGIQAGLSALARNQLEIFSRYINENYGEEYATADRLFSQKQISPVYIPYLFKPGDVLVSRQEGKYCAYVASSWPLEPRITSISHLEAQSFGDTIQKDYFDTRETWGKAAVERIQTFESEVKVWSWEFDGNFRRTNATLLLHIPFNQARKNDESKPNGKKKLHDGVSELQSTAKVQNIADLNVFPLQYAAEDIVNLLRRRGRTFWNFRKRRLVSYQEDTKCDIGNLAEERHMIDMMTYRSLHNTVRLPLKGELGVEVMEKDDIPEEPFELLLPLMIKGYNLRRKKWFDLVADRIFDVKWNREAFQSLVIEPKARDLIRALVSNQLASERSTDLIAGKGNGLILLLHGGPGTGKTLTAESVAEIAEKPLYRVTCGDIGTKAEDVEKYLESVLHLGKIWGCVVLLDEADVFLEQRSLEDLQRNALVSVFLRVLEYYEGILVLTSNRVGTFDEAFKSRIQLALHYPNLGPYQRLRIWETFINRLESFDDAAIDITDLRDHLGQLKDVKMNGRQIRNVITTARQYTEWKQTVLNYEHLKDVIEISMRFDVYLDRLNGGLDQEQLAEDDGLRLASS